MPRPIPTDIAGRVIAVLKSPGDRVEEGEAVIMVEAMKMEIPVAAPAAGALRSVEVAVDDMVEEDQTVAQLEDPA